MMLPSFDPQRKWRDPALTALAILFLLLMFVIAPLHAVAVVPFLFAPVVAPVLVAAVIAVADNMLAVTAVMFAIGLALVSVSLRLCAPSVLVIYLDLMAILTLGSALIWVVARAVFAAGRVTYHRVVGALLLYLTIGGTFAGLYGILALLVPHALTQMPPPQDGPAIIAHLLYFSFETLTSTGYGDIVPVHPFARAIANLESVFGQLYPATLLARIVTLELADRDR
jgi:hypothetical protein